MSNYHQLIEFIDTNEDYHVGTENEKKTRPPCDEKPYLIQSETVEMDAHDLFDTRPGNLDRLLKTLEHSLRVSEQVLRVP